MKARVRRLMISPEAFFHIMRENSAWRVKKGIPKDARLRGFTLDPYTQVLHLFVEHPSFDEVDVHSVAPQMETLFEKIS